MGFIADMFWLGLVITVSVVIGVFWFQARQRAAVEASSQSISDRAFRKFPQYARCPYVGGATINLYMDSNSKTALIATSGGIAKEIPFSSFEALEILEDGDSVGITKKTGTLSRAALGGVAFGGVGAIVGAVTAGSETTNKEFIRNITVVLHTSDASFPQIAWEVFSANFGLEHMSPFEVQIARKNAQTFAAQFNPIFEEVLSDGTVNI